MNATDLSRKLNRAGRLIDGQLYELKHGTTVYDQAHAACMIVHQILSAVDREQLGELFELTDDRTAFDEKLNEIMEEV